MSNLLDKFRNSTGADNAPDTNTVPSAPQQRFPWQRPTMDDFLHDVEERFRIFRLSSSDLGNAIESACRFFGIPTPDVVYDLTNAQNGQTMFVNYDSTTYGDDILCFNLRQLQQLGVTTQDAFSLIMTHECAHRYFQRTTFHGFNHGAWEEELACDFFMGVRATMEHMDISRVTAGLGNTPCSPTHPDGALRQDIITFGQQAVAELQQAGLPLTLPNFMSQFSRYLLLMAPLIYAHQQPFTQEYNWDD